MLQIKVVENKIRNKKLTGCTCLSPLGVQLLDSKDCRYHIWNIMYWNGKEDSLWGWMMPKIPIISENALNESSIVKKEKKLQKKKLPLKSQISFWLSFFAYVECRYHFPWMEKILLFSQYILTETEKFLRWSEIIPTNIIT